MIDKTEGLSQPFQYVGQYGVMAEPAGLYYMRARYYDPEVGRFISEDPIGFEGGLNLYAYVGGNPVLLSDPAGGAAVLLYPGTWQLAGHGVRAAAPHIGRAAVSAWQGGVRLGQAAQARIMGSSVTTAVLSKPAATVDTGVVALEMAALALTNTTWPSPAVLARATQPHQITQGLQYTYESIQYTSGIANSFMNSGNYSISEGSVNCCQSGK